MNDSLPIVLLAHCISHLSLEDRFSLCRVNKRWKYVVETTPYLIECEPMKYLAPISMLPVQQFRRVCPLFRFISTRHNKLFAPIRPVQTLFAMSCTNITEFTITTPKRTLLYNDAWIQLLANNQNSLRSLQKICGCI